jgi:hypothetical protein
VAWISTLDRIHIMVTAITASFRWSADELLTAQRVHMRHSPHFRKIQRGRWIIAPFGILVGVFILLQHGFQPVGLLGLFCIIVGAVLSVFPLVVRRMTLKHYARRPDRDMLVTWEFHPDHIVSKTEASTATMEWRMISRVLQAAQGFLLYPNDRVFHWLPAHAFREPMDLEAFTQLAKSSVKQFDRVV